MPYQEILIKYATGQISESQLTREIEHISNSGKAGGGTLFESFYKIPMEYREKVFDCLFERNIENVLK